jgi:hypothetical protein
MITTAIPANTVALRAWRRSENLGLDIRVVSLDGGLAYYEVIDLCRTPSQQRKQGASGLNGSRSLGARGEILENYRAVQGFSDFSGCGCCFAFSTIFLTTA